MNKTDKLSLEQSYLTLVGLLMLAKAQIVDKGSHYGLTGMQTMTLFILDTPRPMSNFKRIFSCDASNVTGIIDGLEEKKLAARFIDSGDRRVKMVQLSRKGSSVRAKLIKDLVALNNSVLKSLSEDEVKLLDNIATKMPSPSK